MKKITSIKIKNFRNVEDVSEDLLGCSVLAIGDSRVGKSNFLKAIMCTMGLKSAGKDPLTDGAEDGFVEVKASEFKGDQPINGTEYLFRMKMEKGKSPSLEVIAPNGMRDKKKSVIGSIVGETTFNVFEFAKLSESEAGKRKQLEYVLSLLPQEDIIQINQIKQKIKGVYDERTEANRELKSKEALMKENTPRRSDEDKYTTPLDIVALTDQLKADQELNSVIEQAQSAVKTRTEEIERIDNEIGELEKQIEEKRKQREHVSERLNNAKTYLETHTKVDTSGIIDQINGVSEHNAMVQKIAAYKKYCSDYESAKQMSESLTANYEAQTHALNDFIRSIVLPVDGLSFEDDGIKEAYATYNGKPIDEDNMSTAELMDLGVRIGMAKILRSDDNLGVIFIERGESIGSEIWSQMMDLGKKYGIQYFIEEVQRGKEFEIIKINDSNDNSDKSGGDGLVENIKTTKKHKAEVKKQVDNNGIQTENKADIPQF